MSARPWMPFYFSDYLADTSHLSTTEHGAYLLLIAHYWAHGGLPTDEAVIGRITRMTARQWFKSRDVLRSLFGDNWRHKRIDKELAKAIEKSHINSANAKRRHSERTPEPQRSDTQLQPQSQPEERKQEASLRSAVVLSDWPPDAFDKFWSRYPHKVAKKAALKAFAAAKRSGVPWARVMISLDQYIAEKPRDRAWCNPATWLNGGRWDDEPAAPVSRGPPQSDQPSFHDIARELRSRTNETDDDQPPREPVLALTSPSRLPG